MSTRGPNSRHVGDAAGSGTDEVMARLPAWLEQAWRHLAVATGHAWLLAGTPGLGQWELARHVARTWLCEARGAGQAPCGHCPACQLVNAGTHPDLLILCPDAMAPELGQPVPEESASSRKTKPSQDIRVEQLRAVVSFAQSTPARGHGKVVLIYPAERMNLVAGNTLLKTLEEPPGRTRFLLATEAAQRLLPTTRSRCQMIHLAAPDTAQALAWLQAAGVQDAAQWLALEGGRPVAAWRRARSGLDHAQWRALPMRLAAGDLSAGQGLPPPVLLEALLKASADLIRMAVGAAPTYYAAQDLPAPPTLHRISQVQRTLLAHARHIDHPWHAGLAADAIVGEVWRVGFRPLEGDAATGPRVANGASHGRRPLDSSA